MLAQERRPVQRLTIPTLGFLLAALASIVGLPNHSQAQNPTPGNVQVASRPPDLVVEARLRNGYFEVSQAGAWEKLYIAGVDIGPALPGHFATEAPTDPSTYLEWFTEIGAMGADSIRVYTLLPPSFYQALLDYDSSHPRYPLYLFQEIWFGDPPQGDLFDHEFSATFGDDLREVIDAVHGQANIPMRPGQAGGTYTADVSPYVLGWLIGREIEPHVVTITNRDHPEVQAFQGRYLKVTQGSPSEVWLAKMCDQAVEYEVSKFHAERPVAFVNWPPLDPLTHPSVAPEPDEARVRQIQGVASEPFPSLMPETDDGVALDEEHISPQPEYEAGYFALYHVYPFNPDFIFRDPAYRQARDKQGVNSYWGYLVDLKRHFRNTPVVIGEYGLSTSGGTAHITPSGWNHGGLSEEQQADGLVRFTDNIRDAGYAGGLVFEWIDEWWKHSWIERDFEKPFQRKVFWHNDLDPEQFFGIVKFVPPQPLTYVPIAPADSAAQPDNESLASGGPPRVEAIFGSYEPSALYLDLSLQGMANRDLDLSRVRYVIALNTCDAPCGAEQLPVPGDLRVAEGANFLVDLRGPRSSRLLIARNYNPWRGMPLQSNAATETGIPRNMRITLAGDANFEHMIVRTNELRFAADGTRYREVYADRSFLRYGNFELGRPDSSSLGQWYYDQGSGRIRLRLSWGLLLALDPSEGLVFWGTDDNGSPTGKKSRSIDVVLLSYQVSKDEESAPSQIMAKSISANVLTKGWAIAWPTWYFVEYRSTFKKSYGELSKSFHKLTGYEALVEGGHD